MFEVEYLENPWREKFDFFCKILQVPYFDVYENRGRGSYRLGVKKSFVTHV